MPDYYGKLVMLSYFGRATMNVKDKYLLTATLRNDQTSRFRHGYRSGWFPAAGPGLAHQERGFPEGQQHCFRS